MSDLALYGVVEIMGRRTRAGRLSDAQLGGATLLRIEHPERTSEDGQPLAECYAPQAIFAIRPCSADEATKVAAWSWPAPLTTPALAPVFGECIDDDGLYVDEDDQ